MPRVLTVMPHLTQEELNRRAIRTERSTELLRWKAIARFSRGEGAAEIAKALDRKEDWVRRTVRRYNADGPEGVRDRRPGHGRQLAIPDADFRAVVEPVIHTEAPDGGLWNGPKLRKLVAEKLGTEVNDMTIYRAMKRAGLRKLAPRPRHADSSAEAQEAFKKKSSPNE